MLPHVHPSTPLVCDQTRVVRPGTNAEEEPATVATDEIGASLTKRRLGRRRAARAVWRGRIHRAAASRPRPEGRGGAVEAQPLPHRAAADTAQPLPHRAAAASAQGCSR